MSERGGGLEELFRFREEPVVEVAEPVAKQRPWVAKVGIDLLIIAAATTVAVAALRSAKLHLPLLLLIAVFTGLRLIMRAVGAVRQPAKPKRRSDQAGRAGGAESFDSLRAAVRRWERMLRQAHADPDLFSRNVAPGLAELADERLRLRHGITRSTDPRRARELLGEPLWSALHDPGRRIAKPRELETYVDALERL